MVILTLALLIGASLGLLGGGGSILTVPVLVYAAGYAPKQAIAMSLPVVGVSSLASAMYHWKLGNVRITSTLLFGSFTMLGAFLGAKLSTLVGARTQLALLSLAMIASAISMLRGRNVVNTTSLAPRVTLQIPVALGVGALTGLIGIGGGFLIVPALVMLSGVPMREAVGTSLLIIAMSTAAAFAGSGDKAALDWTFLAGFTAAAVVGALIGASFVKSVSQVVLKRGFAALLFVIGGFLLYQNH